MRTTTIIRMVVIVSSKKYVGKLPSCILVRNNHITSLGIYLVLPADVACFECRCATSFDRSFHRCAWRGGLLLAQRGSGSDARLFAAACGSSGSREAAGTTRC